MSTRTSMLCALAMLAWICGSARAQSPDDAALHDPGPHDAAPHDAAPHDAAPHDRAPHDGAIAPGEQRALPDYDGRPEPGPDAGEIALWVPRILFSPLYLVSEYVLRRPLGFILTELDRIQAYTWLIDLFTFGPDRRAGIVPTAFWEFGFSPSVGLYAFWNRFLVDENRISLHAATWGADWLTFTLGDRWQPSPEILAGARFSAFVRPDQIFGGVGWEATQSEEARYSIEQVEASISFGQRPWRQSSIDYEIGYRSASFESNPYEDDPGVLDRGPPPPGFLTGYQAMRFGARVVIDSRELQELTTGGVHASAFAEQSVGFGALPTVRWLRWGGSLMLATDGLGQGRVLSVRYDTAFITPFDDGDPQAVVPFTELIDVGGDGPLRGFRPGAIRGLSMAALSVAYVWPIWVFLDAHLRASIGNAFGRHLSDFDPERLLLSFDFGVLPRVAGDHPLEILLGFGTHPFESGAELTSVRFAVGTRSNI